MNIEILREHCLSKPATEECFPFDEDTLVFKVMGKMFALTSLREPTTVNLKCEPEYAVELREQHTEIIPGFHMNKNLWNTVSFEGNLDDRFIVSLIDHSYDQVVAKLPKKVRAQMLDL